MKPTHHVIISAGVSAVFWWWFKSMPATIACFLSGIFIDLDHHLDYLIVKKKIPWSYSDLKDYFYNQQYRGGPLYLFFHAYEWFILLWGAIYFCQLDVFWLGLAVGLTAHIIADEIYNPIKPFGYFLTYRILHKFESNLILKPRR